MNTLIFILSLLFSGAFLSDEICQCSGSEQIIDFKDPKNNRLIICGVLNEKKGANFYNVSGFKMIDCVNNKVIEDHSIDEVSKYSITMGKSKILIARNHFLINADWKLISVPAMERSVCFNGKKLCISKERNVFNIPPLSKEQSDSINSLCSLLKERALNKTYYPYDEASIYLLFTGAISGNRDAKYLLANLDHLFILEGAIKETKGEIWIKW